MLKIGVLGSGHLGKIHIKLIKELSEQYELVGFYDPDEEKSKATHEEYKVHAFNSLEELIDKVDVVDVVTPTLSHFECAQKAIRKSKHVFIEKPITHTLEEAKSLINLAEEANVKAQVGHVERYNPAFAAVQDQFDQPMFIETHRLAQFNPRGTDVPVVLDLMIHDIDIVLSVVKSTVKRVSASGVAVVSDTPDIANARIEFDNGCVANLTASRISMKNMRKSRFFQRNAYITVDFLEKTAEVLQLEELSDNSEEDPFAITLDLGEKGKKKINLDQPEIKNTNAIKEELRTFSFSINEGAIPKVTLQDGADALDIALRIMERIKHNLNAIH